MIRPGWMTWCAFCVWAVWLAALQGLAAGYLPWLPDLSLLIVIGLASRVRERELVRVALIGAFARLAFATDPATAVLTGYLAAVGLTFAVRSLIDPTGVGARTFLAGAGVFGFHAWLMLVHFVRIDARARETAFDPQVLVPVAFASAVTAFFLGPALLHLPGLTPLRRRRW